MPPGWPSEPEIVLAVNSQGHVVGATLGTVPAVPGYFHRVREICDKYGVLLILDEVGVQFGSDTEKLIQAYLA